MAGGTRAFAGATAVAGTRHRPRLGRCARIGIARAARCDRARTPRHREPVARRRRGCAARPDGGLRRRARHCASDRVGRRAARHVSARHSPASSATSRGLARRRPLPRQRRRSARRPRRASASAKRSSRRKATSSPPRRSASSRRIARCMACSRGSASWRSSRTPLPARGAAADATRDALAAIDAELATSQDAYHAEQHGLRVAAAALPRSRARAPAAPAGRARRPRSGARRSREELAGIAADENAEQERVARARHELADAQSALHDEIAKRDAARARAQRGGGRADTRPRARAGRRAHGAGSGVRRAELPRPPGRARAPARIAGGAGRAAASAARAARHGARGDRLDARRGSVAEAARGARRCRAGAGRRRAIVSRASARSCARPTRRGSQRCRSSTRRGRRSRRCG